ncbi:hypothetical protein GALL_552470 [mine drainage metagenome]|uniref:Uncharacterized protein n=1 Tax=mine drainage metagenome TaxID=410659 RepID=A0A1J5PDA3_9ZZZZ
MIESAAGIEPGGPACGVQQGDGALRQFGFAGRRIVQGIQGRIEAAEVVEGLGPKACAHCRCARHPVRRKSEYGGGARQLPAERLQHRCRSAGLERQHRRAVRDEKRRQSGHRCVLLFRSIWRCPEGVQDAARTPSISTRTVTSWLSPPENAVMPKSMRSMVAVATKPLR